MDQVQAATTTVRWPEQVVTDTSVYWDGSPPIPDTSSVHLVLHKIRRGRADRLHGLRGAMTRANPLTPEERRSQLLAAARRVFADRGYHKAGVSHIIREAGVARGTFYNYFESKRAVFTAVLDELTSELGGSVVPIDVTQPIAPQARENVKNVVEAVMRPDVVRLLFAEAVGIDAEGDAAVREFYTAAEDRLTRALETGRLLGIVRTERPRIIARCILGMVREPVFLASLRGEALEADALVDEVTAILTGGVVAVRLD
jgi:AcrR family transcriptional regulator